MEKINFFAEANYQGARKKFGIKRDDRRQHMYVIGKTGVGKTSLLKNMAMQDIANGEGLGIIDPHGEFAEEILEKIPPHRINDVVYFNPADINYPVSFNALEVPDPKYKHLVASGLMSAFTKIWANVWSARMEYILANCILALLDTRGTTLLGILRMLNDRNYRQKIINNVKDPVVKSFWANEYEVWDPRYRNEAIAPIQNKVGQFLNVSLIRNIVGQSKSTIKIDEIMDQGKVLIMNLSKGRIGEDSSSLLGAIMINKIQLAAMERVRIPEEERRDFYLYVDEFQNFVTQSFTNILSEARKYHLDLILAHQYIAQLSSENNTEVRDAVFGNVGTIVSFRVGAADAEFLESEFSPEFTAEDLVNLPNYHIYLKLMIDGVSSRPFSATTIPPMKTDLNSSAKEKIIRVSRERYGVKKEIVEQKIAQWSGMSETTLSWTNSNSNNNLHTAKCSICGKETKVPFVPDGNRPVYCKSCLEKIKKGEIKVPKYNPIGEEKINEYSQKYPELSELGIEFEPLNNNHSQNDQSQKSSSQKSQPQKMVRGEKDNSVKNTSRINNKELEELLKKALRQDKR